VERLAINRDEDSTRAFSKAQKRRRKVLDAPAEDTVAGLRDRAILPVGLQVGLRRAEIATLKVGDLHENRGYGSLRVSRKGGRRDCSRSIRRPQHECAPTSRRQGTTPTSTSPYFGRSSITASAKSSAA
jgi:integrase